MSTKGLVFLLALLASLKSAHLISVSQVWELNIIPNSRAGGTPTTEPLGNTMKSLRTSLGLTTLVGLSLAVAPSAFALDTANVDTNTAIGSYWAKNKDALGPASGAQQTFANGSSQQVFEKGVLTYGRHGGVRVLAGQAGKSFIKAGGAEKFGNAESSPWKHAYCGQSITTFDGKTRWLVVLDEKTQPGSSINLSSPEAKKWKAERAKTGHCFTQNAVLDTPAQPLTPEQTSPAPDTAFGNASTRIAEARAKAVSQGISVAAKGGQLTKVTDDLVTQDFGGNISAIYSRSQDKALIINTDALAVYLADPASYGKYLYQNEYTKNRVTGALELRALFYNSTAEQCSAAVTSDDHGYALFSARDQSTVISQYFIQYDDNGNCINWDNQNAASPVSWAKGLMDRTPVGSKIDSTYDWSKAKYIPIQQVLELRVDGSKVVYIKADSKGKPLAGAQPVESAALTEALNLSERGRFSAYNDWANGGNWNMWDEMTMLGAPTGPAKESTSKGTTIVTQPFEGGTLVWTKGTVHMTAELNDLGKAKLKWYNNLGV